MYADRHDWPISSLDVDLRIVGTSEGNRIRRVLRIDGPDAAAREKLAEVAERTPVTLTVKHGMPVETTLAENSHD